MALILHVDTALEKAFVGLAQNDELLMGLENDVQNNHAGFVQPAIHRILAQLQVPLANIDAVGVTSGPGSYTGLRVGMSSAKGICYALSKPLLAISSLEIMTLAAIEAFPGFDAYCPMIDARRNEVYTALYNPVMKQVLPPHAAILSVNFLNKELESSTILFFGNGSIKWKIMHVFSSGAGFENVSYNGKHLSQMLFNLFKNNRFADLAYAEPLYVKDFHFAGAKLLK